MLRIIEKDEAFEVLEGGHGEAPLVLTCEHASQRMPPGWSWPYDDQRLIDTHWAYDIGAEGLVRVLAEGLGARAVLARFSRLLVDPNRPEDSDTLFLPDTHGEPVALNAGLDPAERTKRLDRLHRRYHEAVRRTVQATPGRLVLAVHTFTPVWQGKRREVGIGVLYDRDVALAEQLAERLRHSRWEVRLNEPYSGQHGLIWSAQHHADATGRSAIEIEIRQDLADDPVQRSAIASEIVQALHAVGLGK